MKQVKQADFAAINKTAWETDAYATWVTAYGTPETQADILKADPKKKLRRILPYLDSVEGKVIANPLGSHGRVAVALALLGAEVTVFDISEANARYGLELARAANTSISYVTSDFITSSQLDSYQQQFDLVVLELGILHYFLDLNQFVQSVARLLKNKGQVILNEFHPLATKCFTDDTIEDAESIGDYFNHSAKSVPVAFEVFHQNPETLPKCLVKYWTLGEVLTSFAQNGFQIEKLLEFPEKLDAEGTSYSKIPKQFTLLATKSM